MVILALDSLAVIVTTSVIVSQNATMVAKRDTQVKSFFCAMHVYLCVRQCVSLCGA